MAADLTWDAARMAKFIDLTPRRLAQLVQEGVVERAERGRYNPFVVTVAYIRWLRDQRSNESDPDTDKALAEAASNKSRRQKAEADTAEMTAAEQGGTLMLTKNHERWCGDYGAQVRAKTMDAAHISEESKKKLLTAFASIKVVE